MHEQDSPADPHSKLKHRVVEDERDDLGRRKWRLEHYEEDDLEKPLTALYKLRGDVRNQSYLVPREKLAISNKNTKHEALKKANKDGGFYCTVCRYLYKCDTAYLTHLNSSSHNRKLGMSQKVYGVTVDSVRDKLQSLKGGMPKQMTMVERMMKAEIMKDKNRYKTYERQKYMMEAVGTEEPNEQPQQPNEHQDGPENEQPNESSDEQPKEELYEYYGSEEEPKQEPEDYPEDEPAPDQTLLLMQSLGLPTSFRAKRR